MNTLTESDNEKKESADSKRDSSLDIRKQSRFWPTQVHLVLYLDGMGIWYRINTCLQRLQIKPSSYVEF